VTNPFEQNAPVNAGVELIRAARVVRVDEHQFRSIRRAFPSHGEAEPSRCFWKPRRASLRMRCSSTATGTQLCSRSPSTIWAVGTKV